MANIVLVLMAPVRIPSPPHPVPIPVTPLHPHLSAPPRCVCELTGNGGTRGLSPGSNETL